MSTVSTDHPTIRVIDSHTGGEPTRVVVEGGPDLGRGGLAQRREVFRDHFDDFRSAVCNEPRGSDTMVGALLCEPVDPSCSAGVIFFNNVGMLNMCGHGTIGLLVTLAHLGRIGPGTHRIETPVGVVEATLHPTQVVTVRNVPSYRFAKDVVVDVEGYGPVRGDIAWGGNWFFLVGDHAEMIALANVERLTDFSWKIRQALERQGITGENGAEIDHIELFGPSLIAHSKNFVLCPGKAYDRSPCGTGTSAKLACLAADGKLKERENWRQESLIGSVFDGYVTYEGAWTIPHIQGRAYVMAESTLILNPDDPFRMGIRG
ncbi:4-hydroxyproline epimerase [Tundrisphaera lichenicola]|uniref:4-hydroxyproline epimerase n=1 Tax=Tundrisphaera lichenicola TaxID=2029860 RepID=UPI003EBCD322